MENQNARHQTGAGGFSKGRDVPARMYMSISKRNISASMCIQPLGGRKMLLLSVPELFSLPWYSRGFQGNLDQLLVKLACN